MLLGQVELALRAIEVAQPTQRPCRDAGGVGPAGRDQGRLEASLGLVEAALVAVDRSHPEPAVGDPLLVLEVGQQAQGLLEASQRLGVATLDDPAVGDAVQGVDLAAALTEALEQHQ